MRTIAAFFGGALFAVGLLLAGMTRPERVIGFLDLGGAWDPTLAFVMAGAIAIHVLGLRVLRRRAAPMYAPRFELPTRADLDARLFLGAGLFGIGWGLAGYCPGPALVSLGAGGETALVFVGAATVGMLVQHLSPAAPVG
jgi:uncharacterized membrane protein YedE/YeeE